MPTDRTLNAADFEDPRARARETGLALMVVTSAAITTVPLKGRRDLVVGRAPDVDVRLDDPLASKRHARIEVGDHIQVTDLDSTNGTHVRDVRINPNQPVTIQLGEGVRIGATIIMVQRVRSATAVARRIWDHGDFKERVNEECERATLVGKTLMLVRLQFLPGGAEGAAPAEKLLRQLVGSPHVLARYAQAEYEVLLTECSTDEAEATVKAWLDSLHAAGLSPRVGLAAFPRDGRSVDALVSRANAQLRERPRPTSSSTGDELDDRPMGAAMRGIYKLARKAASSDMNILLLGETGAGKEVLAQAIHRWSERSARQILTINCAGLTDTLLESELFGHEKGAFTDAHQSRPGLLEAAEGGTVFFDELGEMSAKMQQRLLRALETREVTRVGSVRPRKIDVRVIAATNRDMEDEVQAGNFRSDLFYRFGGFVIHIPPLRERKEEVPWLAHHFAREMCEDRNRPPVTFTSAAVAQLVAHDWPGNIRELKNIVDRAVVLCDGDVIDDEHIQLHGAGFTPATPATGYGGALTGVALLADAETGPLPASGLDESARPLRDDERGERDRMVAMLKECFWNVSEAARRYPMPRRTFVAKMKRFGIPGPRGRARG